MNTFAINGIVPVIPTPFNADGQVDTAALPGLLDFAVQSRVCAVCLPAYASEFYKLTDAERVFLIQSAIEILGGKLPLVAQVNHGSSAYATQLALECERAGAAAISVAVPRLFDLPERDLLRFFDRLLSDISIPLVIQDFNPGGGTISVDFIKSLHAQHPHFQYFKLEEPLMSGKVHSILDATSGGIGVIDGWGGAYMLELIDAGICGVMPGLAVSDLLQEIWGLARAGDKVAAYDLFQGVLPQIIYSLQSLEFFHHAEKSLLAARGVLSNPAVRDATLTIHEVDRHHIEFLNSKIIALARKQARLGAGSAA